MASTNTFFRQHATRILALAVILMLYGFARLPTLDQQQRQKMAERFSFTELPLPEVSGFTQHFSRPVNPNLKAHDGWISGVGAAVSLNDLDADGLANDLCYVDTRINQVIVAPAPGTGERYQPHVLSPSPLPYHAETSAPMGCIPGDVNEDGRMDLIVYYWGRSPIIFLGKETGDYLRQELLAEPERWFSNSGTLADLDGDGHIDLVMANYFQDGAHILDAKATQPDEMQHSMSRAFNGGGTHFFLWKNSRKTATPSVNFQESHYVLSDEINYAWTLALGAQDLDGDLLPELYFANDFGPDRLLHNRSKPGELKFALLEGERDFTMPASRVLGKDSFKGMGIDFADLNGDGIPDMFVSNIAAEYALEESHFMFISSADKGLMKRGIAPYKDRGEEMGVSRSNWSWDTKLADFDNDGSYEALQATGFLKGTTNRWPEVQELAIGNDENMATHNVWPKIKLGDDLSGHVHMPFYVLDEKGRYQDLANDVGLGRINVSRGIAVSDIDGDGDLDFAVANQWEPSFLYRNDCPHCKNFIGLHLRFPIAKTTETTVREGHPVGLSRPAIGASAELKLANGHSLYAQVDGGNGHSGRRSPDLHFGLNSWLPSNHIPLQHSDKPVQLRLRWRDTEGVIHNENLSLKPGWHTVELATSTPE